MTVLGKIRSFFKRPRKTAKSSQPEAPAGSAEKKAAEAPKKKTG